ncbi:MAG: SGNH/GDSL hydrolase family protein [Clostridiales bacterium]|nr:SGNH/GDSL hydrolase family protein [Clostridiales bacterium]
MKRISRICVASLSAAICTAGVLIACAENTPGPAPEDGPKAPPAIEYTIDESVLESGKDANHQDFYVENVQRVENSPLADKTIYWLGSSVTYGANSGGYAMAEYLAAKTGATCKKDAVSGTTIFCDNKTENTGAKSYTTRLTNSTVFDKNDKVDAFVCQISTNDAIKNRLGNRGKITGDDFNKSQYFDLKTTIGGVEYIIAYVIETWDCPVYFYSGSYFGDNGSGETRTNNDPSGTNYSKLIDDVKEVVAKWRDLGYEVDVIDMYNDEDFNSKVSDAYYKWCTNDPIHPKRAGYLNWWMPYFEQFLTVKLDPKYAN